MIKMRYKTEVTINLPREKVITLMDSFENLMKWQPNLKKYEHIGGELGKVGAVTRLTYEGHGGNEMEMTETVLVRNFPEEFVSKYTSGDVVNIFKSRFEELDTKSMKWKTVSIFKFNGRMAIKSLFQKKRFKESTLKSMTMFKEFAESHG
jgi:hypothetical protein